MFRNKKVFIVLTIPILFLMYGLITISDYGINWDEPFHYRRGQAFLQYLLTGQKTYSNIPKYPALKGDSDNPEFRNGQKIFQEVQINPSLSNPNFRRSFYQDDSWDGTYFINELDTYGHPPLNDVLAAVFNKIFYQNLNLFGDLESYRLFIIFSIFLASIFIGYFMWKEFGLIASIVSSLAFCSYPLILGEQHFNIKDPVEASFYTITILTTYWAIKKNKFSWFLVAIFAFSIALGTKFNIVFCIIPLVFWFLFYIYKNYSKVNKNKLIRNIVIAYLITPIISLGILILSYPTLWKNPINGLLSIVKFYKEVGYPSSQPQNLYSIGFINTFPTLWIIYSTPPVLIGLFLFTLVYIKKLIDRNDFVLLLFLWFLIVVGRNSLFGALSYGGVRIIMEYVPALCMLAGVGADFIGKSFKNKKNKILILFMVISCFVPTILKLIKIHPNENVYFNFLIGGLAGAKAANLPYWGDSYGNAYYPGLLWINKNAEIGAKVSIPVGLTSNIPRFKLRPDIAVSLSYWSGLEHKGEYLIELTYDYLPMKWFALEYLNAAMVPAYEVKVDGVAIAKVWKNDLAHVKPEFEKQKDIPAKIISDAKNKTLKVTIPNNESVMEINISVPVKNCSVLKTGYVMSSSDGKNWNREEEDIAVDQLNREEIKPLSSVFDYYFFERYAKVFIFNTDSSNNCLLKATSAKVTTLIP